MTLTLFVITLVAGISLGFINDLTIGPKAKAKLERKVNAGIYYQYQYYIPEWDIDQLRPRESDIGSLHEIGVSVGLKQPVTLLGVSFSRVRVGYNWGSGVEGWTFGTEFPF